MIIVFWIVLAGILVAIGITAASTIKTMRKPRWGIVPTDNLLKKEIIITTGGKTFHGFVYTSTDFTESPPMPGMLLLPDRDEKYPGFEHWAAIFALQGFPTLAVDLYGKKMLAAEFLDVVSTAFPSFKQALTENANVDPSGFGMLGFGESALAGLYAGSADDEVKAICCAGMPRADPSRVNDAMGRIFLAHCKDDTMAPLDEFEANKDSLGVGDRDYLLLDLGGHGFISQEAVIAGYFSIPVHKMLGLYYKQFTPTGVIET
ncbi:MAG TPA: hypothetical protein VKM55_07260 [Candidatus Lokiarchaeia archaeon]|nr:hypothetical protein [Candidatus Lokiarchaeia archaeon]